MSYPADKQRADRSCDRLRSLCRDILRLRKAVAKANGRDGTPEDRRAAREAFDLATWEALVESKRLDKLFVDVDFHRITFDRAAEDITVSPLISGPDNRYISSEALRVKRDAARYARKTGREGTAA